MNLKFSVGDLTIQRIVEQEGQFLQAHDMLPSLTPELLAENRQWLKAAGALDDTDTFIMAFQSYVVKTPHHTILIDSCIGNDKVRPTRPEWNLERDENFMRALAAAGFSVGDIDFVMCTHLHVDHVGWNTRLENGRWVPTFPKARYVFAKGEFDYWAEQHKKAEVPPIADSVLPIVEAERVALVDQRHRIDPWLVFEPSPGHTPGHVCVRLTTRAGEAVFSGDLMHRVVQVAEPQWSSRFCYDGKQAATTRRHFIERHADSGTLVLAAHFPRPGYIVREDGGHRFRPA